jgi:hypothetical protein
MTFKMQADIGLLQAHYDQLESRIAELEEKQQLIHLGINNILGENNTRTLRLTQDRMPVPRNKNKGNKNG